MRVIFQSHWHPNANGTDYHEALGEYPSLDAARNDACNAACDKYEWPSEAQQDEDGIEDEGPDVVVYDYDSDPEGFDGQRAGGGSFADDF